MKNKKKNNEKFIEHLKIRSSIKYKKIKQEVLKRDNNTCQNCKKSNKKLHVHHIKSFNKYPKLRLNLDNLITLCPSCHIGKLTDPITLARIKLIRSLTKRGLTDREISEIFSLDRTWVWRFKKKYNIVLQKHGSAYNL